MPEKKTRILFVCTKVGGRASLAAACARHLAGDRAEALSASFERGSFGKRLGILMQEKGIAFTATSTPTIFDRYQQREAFDYVVTLCGDAEMCQVFSRIIDTLYAQSAERVAWSVPDFASLKGSWDEWTEQARTLCDQIHRHVEEFLSSIGCQP